MRSALVVLTLLAALVAASPAPAAEPAPWTIGEISGPQGTTRVRPAAINASGVVVGGARFPGRAHDTAFRWENGQMTELVLPTRPGTRGSWAFDISDEGVIVGSYDFDINPADQYQNRDTIALRWENATAAPTELGCCFPGTGPSPTGGEGSNASAINEDGIITGVARKETGEWCGAEGHVFKWSGAFTDLSPAEDACHDSQGLDINEEGTVLASILYPPSDRGAIYKGGVRTILDLDPGDQGLNDLGHVVGQRPYNEAKPNDKLIARIWDGEKYTNIGAEGTHSKANAVNNSDWAVGRSGIADYQWEGGTAYLWRPNAPAASLNSLIGSGWNLEEAMDINDDGTIVGRGFHGPANVGFILSPAGLAYQLTGKVTDGAGAPVAGVAIRVLHASDGKPAGEPVKTDAAGKYTWTLPRGSYRVTALPEGGYGVVANPDCTIVTFHCDVSMTRNRVADFQAVPASKPDPGPATQTPVAPARDTIAPAFALPADMGKLKVVKGAAAFKLPAFTEPVTGTITFKAGKKTIGTSSFEVAAGKAARVKVKLDRKLRKRFTRGKRKLKAVATVVARDAAGNATTRTAKLTLIGG
jgi:uncharacterized membrane protein